MYVEILSKVDAPLLYFEARNLANTTSKKNAALQVYNSLLAELLDCYHHDHNYHYHYNVHVHDPCLATPLSDMLDARRVTRFLHAAAAAAAKLPSRLSFTDGAVDLAAVRFRRRQISPPRPPATTSSTRRPLRSPDPAASSPSPPTEPPTTVSSAPSARPPAAPLNWRSLRNPSLIGFQSKRRRVHQAGTLCLTLGAVYLILAKVLFLSIPPMEDCLEKGEKSSSMYHSCF
ncbi:uncharacterized protein LOC124655681 [Lolium rigidum]|uniref:uncharacterized protein LOC124655681 n=1 Tax=Lolium rigidum TaxID=89674 RepID=UPI001F5D6D6C|nr:uncharacterized protein LOC124655681 [Lolium rigidum]